VPFLLVWGVPLVYWVGGRERDGWPDDVLHVVTFVSMGWLNFLFIVCVARDAILLATLPLPPAHAWLAQAGSGSVVGASLVAFGLGALAALRGPRIRHVDVPLEGLVPALHGMRIVQISDLHVGPTMRARYVRRVVAMTRALTPDLIALTGDIVDGPVRRLAPIVAPLRELAHGGRAFLVLGNHDYYAGAADWSTEFETLGLRLLRNEHAAVARGDARIVVGGVIDFAARLEDREARPRPDLAIDGDRGAALRLLLAHNPGIAPLAEAAGFDLQLSGHTHGGQFFPWTIAVRFVHGPHAAGLARRGRMWVYVSAGTGTWGPPVRFGTTPELTVLRLVPAEAAAPAAG
jgi:predicted MPP superfamily phosphohydrolase